VTLNGVIAVFALFHRIQQLAGQLRHSGCR